MHSRSTSHPSRIPIIPNQCKRQLKQDCYTKKQQSLPQKPITCSCRCQWRYPPPSYLLIFKPISYIVVDSNDKFNQSFNFRKEVFLLTFVGQLLMLLVEAVPFVAGHHWFWHSCQICTWKYKFTNCLQPIKLAILWQQKRAKKYKDGDLEMLAWQASAKHFSRCAPSWAEYLVMPSRR